MGLVAREPLRLYKAVLNSNIKPKIQRRVTHTHTYMHLPVCNGADSKTGEGGKTATLFTHGWYIKKRYKRCQAKNIWTCVALWLTKLIKFHGTMLSRNSPLPCLSMRLYTAANESNLKASEIFNHIFKAGSPCSRNVMVSPAWINCYATPTIPNLPFICFLWWWWWGGFLILSKSESKRSNSFTSISNMPSWKWHFGKFSSTIKTEIHYKSTDDNWPLNFDLQHIRKKSIVVARRLARHALRARRTSGDYIQ